MMGAKGHLLALRVIGLTLWLLLTIAPASIDAHGGGAPQLTNAEAGPYRVFVWTQPEPWRVGEVHLSIAVTLPPQPGTVVDEGVTNNMLDTPVTDANVTVTMTPVGGGEPLTVKATLVEQLGSLYYEADGVVPAAGTWQVAVDVSGPLGEGAAIFVTEALAARSNSALYLLGGVIVAALAVVGLIGRRRKRS